MIPDVAIKVSEDKWQSDSFAVERVATDVWRVSYAPVAVGVTRSLYLSSLELHELGEVLKIANGLRR